MARKIIVTRRDFVREAAVTWSGGSWQSGAPLTNLADIRPQFAAEATDNDWASTKFSVDLLYQRNVGLFHFQGLRSTSAGILSIKAGTDPTFATNTYALDTTTWPQDSQALGNTPWGEFTLNGVYDGKEYAALGMPRFLIPPAPVAVRYIHVEIKDNTNPSPLTIGCFGACEVWEPPRNLRYGWDITVVDESGADKVPYGTTEVTRRGKRRVLNFGWDVMPAGEVFARQLGILLIKGKSDPLVAVQFPDDTPSVEKLAVYGLFNNDPAIANPSLALYSSSFQLEQLI